MSGFGSDGGGWARRLGKGPSMLSGGVEKTITLNCTKDGENRDWWWFRLEAQCKQFRVLACGFNHFFAVMHLYF